MQPNQETRQHVDACVAALPADPPTGQVVFGFDGVVDNVREVVAERSGPDRVEMLTELSSMGDRITSSVEAGSSLSLEWVNHGTRPGGHVSHLTRAFGRLGMQPTLIGTAGDPPREEFTEAFGDYTILTLGTPEVTDAIEFHDGKLMLRDTGASLRMDWETVRERVGLERLAEALDGARLLGVGYWSALPRIPAIINGLTEDLWPLLASPPGTVLTDPGDVRQLDGDTIRECVDAVRRLNEKTRVVVSANRAETVTIADLFASQQHWEFDDAVRTARDGVGTHWFVGHSSDQTAAATPADTAQVQVPRTSVPEMTTSAGDHFNVGLGVAVLEDLDVGPALVLANAFAGWFVRHGSPPTYDDARAFVHEYMARFGD